MVPSLLRLDNHDAVVMDFLEGLLEAVQEATPAQVQEEVLDAAGLIWTTVGYKQAPERMIQAAQGFAPALAVRVRVTFTPTPDAEASRLFLEGVS
jgi:hypothetical protein